MNKLEKLQRQAQSQELVTEIKDSPDWMSPYTKMLIVKKTSGFILQVAAYDQDSDTLKVIN